MHKEAYTWDSEEYSRHSSAQYEWALELIGKLGLQATESVLDIGCGDGKVTAALAARVPDGCVVGIDSSEAMISLARRTFPEADFKNLSFDHMDASRLTFENRFDVVFSNAALHWVRDHVPVLQGIKRSLRPPGRILLQMGGDGNAHGILSVIDELMVRDAWRPYFGNFIFPYGFYGPDDYRKWLALAGLREKRIELIPKDMKQKGREGLSGWIRTTWLPYTELVPSHMRETFIAEIVDIYLRDNPIDDSGYIHVSMARLEVEAENC
ncbi:methyltransferase domain-containing protein [bacterium]|nr:methyltransferase domain-containing protein [bacterium]